MKIRVATNGSKDYPEKLTQLIKPPQRLHILGDLENLLSMPALGIVGSRKVTDYGRSVTEDLAAAATRAGICIISGLALGVDSIAHMATLRANGKTVAVLPSGINNIYPASHRQLARNIAASGGVLISEYEDDFKPRRESFIQRNRIIAALSDALLVTEAAEKSGSLHTANFALEMGRTVLAVPGNITNANSSGTNNLLKSGAILVNSAEDIFQALGINPTTVEQLDIYGDNKEESLLIELLRSGISNGGELMHKSKLDTRLFQQTLSMLEIKGVIAPLTNNNWRLK